MIVYRVAVNVRPSMLARASSMFDRLTEFSREVPGVLHFDILQDPADATRFVSIEVYEDQAAVDRQSALPEVDQVMAAFDTLLSDGPHGTVFHVSSTEPWPFPTVSEVDGQQVSHGRKTTGTGRLPGDGCYAGLAAEYDVLLGQLALRTWRQGVLVDVSRLAVEDIGTVVDLGAGTGIGGRLLGSAGCRHRIGVDRSAAMLRQARAWYEQTLQTDAGDIPLPADSVDLVVSGFDSLNYLDATSLGRCLSEAGRVLKPNGWMIFDYSSPHLLAGEWRDSEHVDELADGTLHWRHHYNPDADRCATEMERRDTAGGVRWRETHVQYALHAERLSALARAAGLRVDRVRDLYREPFSPACNTHVWVLRQQVV